MQISRGELGNVLKAYVARSEDVKREAGEKKAAAGDRDPQGDALTLSAQAQEIQRLREVLDRTPDVRAERVKSLAEDVAAGAYRVDPAKVAAQMLGRMLGDKLL